MAVPMSPTNQNVRRRTRSAARSLASSASRACRNASRFTSYGGAMFWARQVSNIWSKSIGLCLRKVGDERRLDPVNLHADVAFAQSSDLRHFAVAEAIQHQKRERPAGLVELRDPLIDPLEPRI